MKTYTTTIEKPILEIRYDSDPQSPREDSNLGYFITVDRNYSSPDKHPTLEAIVKETGDEADTRFHHMRLISQRIKEEINETVLFICPVKKHEHGNVSYSRGIMNQYDYSNNGFYIVTDKTQKIVGTPKELFEKLIDGELNDYTQYANGEIYCYTLYDDAGEIEDSCCGFYNIEDIREYLPEEWKHVDLSEYIKTS